MTAGEFGILAKPRITHVVVQCVSMHDKYLTVIFFFFKARNSKLYCIFIKNRVFLFFKTLQIIEVNIFDALTNKTECLKSSFTSLMFK